MRTTLERNQSRTGRSRLPLSLAVLILFLGHMGSPLAAQAPVGTGSGPSGNAGGSHAFVGPGPGASAAILWELDIPDGYRQGTPVAFGDYLLVTARSDEFGANLTVYTLADGTFLWNYADAASFSDPFVSDGRVFLLQDDRRLALDLESGEVVWVVTLASDEEPAPKVSTDITVADGTLFTNHNAALIALDAETGDELWRRAFADHVMEAPIVAGDVVVASSVRIDDEGNRVATRTHGISRETGNEVWRIDGHNTSMGYEASGDGEVVLVYEFSDITFEFTDATIVDAANGQAIWSPFVTCGTEDLTLGLYADVYRCVGSTTLLDAATGDPRIDVAMLTEEAYIIATGGTTLYVADLSGALHGVDRESGEVLWTMNPSGVDAVEGELPPLYNVSVGTDAAAIDITTFDDDGEPEYRAVIIGDAGAPSATPASSDATPAS